jgi:hypothetical protein
MFYGKNMKKSFALNPVFAAIIGTVGLVQMGNAVNVNPDGVGQVLVYPHYTVAGGQSTLISVINTTAEGKALKVKIVDGYEGSSVLDFNLYLSPFDTWSGAIFGNGSSAPGARFVTNDLSCTVPTSVTNTQLSSPVGHVEVYEMGRLNGSVLDAVRHGDNGVPNNCNALASAFSGGQWRPNGGNLNAEITPPNGGLFGSAAIVDVPLGISLPYTAVALDGFYQLNGSLHSQVGSLTPNLGSAADDRGVGGAQAQIMHRGGVLALDFETGLEAVSAVLTAAGTVNEYNTEPSLAASTDWTVTFPTRRLHRDSAGVQNPFGADCTGGVLRYYNREEKSGDNKSLQFCNNSTVLGFNVGIPRVLGDLSSTTVNFDSSDFNLGWSHLGFAPQGSNGLSANYVVSLPHANNRAYIVEGLPVLGFSANNFVNGSLSGGFLANYSLISPHKYDKRVVEVEVDANGVPVRPIQ